MKYSYFFIGLGSLIILGILAFVVVNNFPNKESNFPQNLSGVSGKDEERKFVALGDSITKANNLSSSLRGDHPEYSFSTGIEIESVYKYLKDKGENLTPINLASSGAPSADVLMRQVPNALGYTPKYITLLTGGVDLGTGVSALIFADNLRKIVNQIKRDNTIVLIGTLPNINKLRSASYPSCGENIIGLQMGNFTNEKIKGFNEVISQVARENNLILVDLYGTLDASDVSDYDCLHPTIKGQEKIAKEFIKALQ